MAADTLSVVRDTVVTSLDTVIVLNNVILNEGWRAIVTPMAALVGAILGGIIAIIAGLWSVRYARNLENKGRAFLIRAIVLDELSALAQLLHTYAEGLREYKEFTLNSKNTIEANMERYLRGSDLIIYLQPHRLRPFVTGWFRDLRVTLINLEPFYNPQSADKHFYEVLSKEHSDMLEELSRRANELLAELRAEGQSPELGERPEREI